MPPKRKRSEGSVKDDEGTTSTRSTRSSTRLSGASAGTSSNSSTAATPAKKGARNSTNGAANGKGNGSSSQATAVEHGTPLDVPDKKKRKTKGAPVKANVRSAKNAVKQGDDEDDSRSNTAASESATSSINAAKAAAAMAQSASHSHTAVEQLSTASSMFDKYADPDEPSVIGPEGLEKLCQSAGISMEGAMPLLLAWILDSKEMGKFTITEWMKGMNDFGINNEPSLAAALSDLNDAVILNKPVRKTVSPGTNKGSKARSTAAPEYKKDKLFQISSNVQASFSNLYSFCFTLAKPESSRNIDMEIASAFWTVLLQPQFPIISEIVCFIDERGTYRGVNKDLWSMMYEFCRIVKPSLEGYDNDGAWPTLLDDFVSWKKEKSESAK